MKKTLLFLSCLVASIGAWAYGDSDADKHITSQAGCTFSSSYFQTTNKHFTVLVTVPEGSTFTIENMTFENNNTDWQSNGKNWAVLGVQGAGTLILKNCTLINPNKGAGINVYESAKVQLDSCNIEVSGYRGSPSCCMQTQSEYASIVINGGKYISNDGSAILVTTSGGTVDVFDGTFASNATTEPWVYASSGYYTGAIFCDRNGYVNVHGGTFYGAIFDKNNNSKVTIEKGRFSRTKVVGNDCNPAAELRSIGDYISFDGWKYVGYSADTVYKRIRNEGWVRDPFESIRISLYTWYYTACFDRTPTYTNVKFYEPAYRNGNTVYFDEVEEIVAGKSYVYKVIGNGDTAKFSFDVKEPVAELSYEKGLIGTIDGINYDVWNKSVIDKDDNSLLGYYLLDDTKLVMQTKAGGFVKPNYAYLTIDDLSTTNPGEPEGERIALKLEGYVPTACAKVAATNAQDGKVIIDGKVFIRRNGQIFSVLGNAVE